MVLKGIANLITSYANPDKWYCLSYQFTKQYAKLKPLPDNNLTKINSAIKLDALLWLLSETGQQFPIPVKINGLELFNKPRPNGLILCSAHMPLLPVALRTLVENEIKLDALIIKPIVKDNRYPLFGINYGIPVINNSPSVLLKAKTVLKNSGIVIALADEDTGYKKFSPNIFHLAQKLQSDMIYFFSELKPDGTIEVSFHEAPKIANEDGDLAKLRISTLNDYRNKIFNIQQNFVIEHIC